MERKLQTYQLELTAKGPVFVGSGREIQKKDYYLFEGQNQLGVMDIEKLYKLVHDRHLEEKLEQFLLDDTKNKLAYWARDNKISPKEMRRCMRYVLDTGDLDVDQRQMKIQECIKDPYGNPYIPGSSIKGMLRTILLGTYLSQHKEECEEERIWIRKSIRRAQEQQGELERERSNIRRLKASLKGARGRDERDEIERAIKEAKQRESKLKRNLTRTKLLERETKQIEAKCFRVLEHPGTKSDDAVNDYMAGVIVSDSEPLTVEDLTLCQKWEQRVDGRLPSLNVVRECLKPGTVIRCKLTIDTTVSRTSAEELQKAVKLFYNQYYEGFQKHFPCQEKGSDSTVFLGGGSGFASKTVLYSLFGEEGVRRTKELFDLVGFPEWHNHGEDLNYGVSPHILKCTKYEGRTYQMGECELKILPI